MSLSVVRRGWLILALVLGMLIALLTALQANTWIIGSVLIVVALLYKRARAFSRGPAKASREEPMPPSDWLMTYRPVSQMLAIFVLPEIDRRVASGVIAAGQLPIQVHQLRLVQPGAGHRVELNDEVQLQVDVAVKRPVKAGEPVALNDIDPEKCFLKPPLLDGKPASYFLVQSAFLNLHVMFDFTQEPSGAPPVGGPAGAMKYDVAGFVQAWSFVQAVKPLEKFRQLADLNWPPAPGYYPNVLAFAHNNPGLLAGHAGAEAYGPELWAQRLSFWKEAKFFPGRLQYVQKAVERYLDGDWISAVYVAVPQFEGIIREYLVAAGVTLEKEFRQQIAQLRTLILSRRLLLFPRGLLDTILDCIETGTFWKNTHTIGDPSQEVNRHGIAHGVFTGFESRDIALKYLVLLDGLALLLLHDKTLTNKLS